MLQRNESVVSLYDKPKREIQTQNVRQISLTPCSAAYSARQIKFKLDDLTLKNNLITVRVAYILHTK